MDPQHLLSNGVFEYHRSGTSNELLIAFVNRTPSERLLTRSPYLRSGRNLLVANCHRVANVSDDLDNLLNIIPTLITEVKSFLDLLQPKRVFTVGHSLGAFPAIVVGAQIQASRIVAMSPETLIGMPLSRSRRRLRQQDTTYDIPDLVPFIERNPVRDLKVIVGELDVVDMYSAARLSGLSNVNLHSLPKVDHEVVDGLRAIGKLSPTLRGIGHSKFALGGVNNPWFDGDAEKWFNARRKLNKSPAWAESELRILIEKHPDNSSLMRHLARALVLQNRAVEASDVLRNAIELAPGRQDLIRKLGELTVNS